MLLKEHENRRVLIVDDQKEIHDDFVEMLRPELPQRSTDELAAAFVKESDTRFLPDFELAHATNGDEACEMIRTAKESNRPIAVAYIDIRMPPGIDGIETVRRVRRIDRDIEVVIMTAYTDRSLPEILHDMELVHKTLYVRKPFTREEIQQMTLSLVGKWNVEQALNENRRQLTDSHQRLEAVLNATADAMAMYDAAGRLVFANHEFKTLFEVADDELNELPQDALMERFGKSSLADVEGKFVIGEQGEVVDETTAGELASGRLFYRSTAPVHDGGEDVIGNLIVYRDVSKEIEVERMKAEVLRLRTELETTYSFAGIVGSSPHMKQVYALMKLGAESDVTVLIRGESGTGKELLAKSFHFNSLRKAGPFVAINCAALPEALIESELFGHEKGAFTGATQQRVGAFERAHGGTIFLDEIGDMQPALQASLLRVLQEKEIQRLGGTDTQPVDVRVIAATNKDLEEAVRAGTFRQDLFFRLAVFPIVIPPLRQRREDIPLLAEHFLKKHTERAEKTIGGLSHATLRIFLQYDWPGNVRELESAIERAVLLETSDVLQVHNLPPHLSPLGTGPGSPSETSKVPPLEDTEREAMAHALAVTGHNVAEAARALKISRATLYRKLRKYDLLSND